MIYGGYIYTNNASDCFSLNIPKKELEVMLWTIIAILIILWLLGFSFSIGGGLIHILLVIAVIVLILRLITGGRAV